MAKGTTTKKKQGKKPQPVDAPEPFEPVHDRHKWRVWEPPEVDPVAGKPAPGAGPRLWNCPKMNACLQVAHDRRWPGMNCTKCPLYASQ